MSLLLSILALVVCIFFSEVSLAQDDVFISSLLSGLDSVGLTNFTSVVRQVQADSTQPTWFLSVSDPSSPKTIFAPNNDAFVQPNDNFFGYTYQPNDTTFLASLLLYHLVPGTWLPENLGTGPNHTVVPTTLQGRGCAFLESDKFQVIAMGSSANGMEVYNQFRTTAVVNTYTYQHLTIHALNAVIGFPGSYSFGAKFMGLNQFSALESTSGSPDLDNQHGMTIFAPSDDAFDPVKSQVASLSPSSLFANHIIYGRTVWYPAFESDIYMSSSGYNYSFSVTPDLGYTVTLNDVTANILRSDFLVNNGVIHVIDQVFWNTTQETVADSSPSPVLGSSTTSPSGSSTDTATSSLTFPSGVTTTPSSSLTSSSANATSAQEAYTPPHVKTPLSAGSIIGIVAIVCLAVVLPVVGIFVWRLRRGSKGSGRRTMSEEITTTMGLPSPIRQITPFTLHTSSQSADSTTNLMPDVFARSSLAESSSTMSPVSGARPRHYPEKYPSTKLYHEPFSPDSDASSQLPQTSSVSVMRPQQTTSPVAMSAEVVENLWQEFAQRIDRGPPPRKSGVTIAPPRYPSGHP